MSIQVDQNTCIGCAACVAIAPACFKMNDMGIAEPISQEAVPEAHEAAGSCPVGAISVE
ncbi:MAG: ferredoxin [Candidatus Falkowbacteria bacterium]